MKNAIVKSVGILGLVVALASCGAPRATYVQVRPNAPVYARPMAPSRNHVWIDGNWVWRNGGYVYQQGYWVVPRRGQTYVAGRWQNNRGGWQWVPGRWQSHGRY